MKFKELFSRAFFSYAWAHFRRGYGMGTAFLLGIFNALNIVIIGLKVFIPSFSFSTLLLIYTASFIAIILMSIGFVFLCALYVLLQNWYFVFEVKSFADCFLDFVIQYLPIERGYCTLIVKDLFFHAVIDIHS